MNNLNNRPTYQYLLVAAIISFLLGVLGNLVAAWLQDKVLKNAFTPQRVIVILAITIGGVLIAVWWERRTQSRSSENQPRPKKSIQSWTRIRLYWSKIKSFGKGVFANDILAVGSEIEINTNQDSHNEKNKDDNH